VIRRLLATALLIGLTGAPVLAREPHRTAEEARTRMEHHLREVNQLATHFEGVLKTDCPRFDSTTEWKTYLDNEVERVVSLMAHLEQAWVEAKSTGDDDVRRAAKAPRKRVDQARALLDKLQGCAQGNGQEISQGSLWRRIEREVPQRQAEIALPQ
jgi:hypothetical protein